MKKILLPLLFLLPFFVNAQTQSLVTTSGVVHTIADAYLSAADSMHFIGIVSMIDADGDKFDSLTITCIAADSLNIRYFVVPYDQLKATTHADSVAGCAFTTNVATGGYEFASGGQAVVPWHNIVAAIKPAHQITMFKIYANVYTVGSEVTSSGKKFRTIVNRY
jgi:hypothetical protein